MATVKEQVKQSLVGTVIEPSLSTDAQATFERHAKKNEETGELYMTQDEFVDAVAPAHEDYVRFHANWAFTCAPSIRANAVLRIAQNQTRAVRHLVPNR